MRRAAPTSEEAAGLDAPRRPRHAKRRRRRGPFTLSRLSSFSALAAGVLLSALARGGDAPRRGDLDARSLPLRTALHHDPTMQPPLEKLLAMYREAGRVSDLVGVYRSHLAQYPADAGAASVLVRILSATGDPEAAGFARQSADAHPRNAFLRYLLYRALGGKGDPRALDELDRAIALEESPARRRAWIEELLPEAAIADRGDLAERHLRGLVELAGDDPDALLAAGRKMLELDHHALALDALERAAGLRPAPEAMVEVEMAAASAEIGLDRMEAAASRLDRLLGRLTADYWRRPEILRRRASLVRTEAERRAMIDAARARLGRNPRDEAAVLDLARVLEGFEFRREALTVLLEGGSRLPDSTPVEKATHSLLDRLRDERGREAYLAARLERSPGRADLVEAHARTLYLLGRRKEARHGLDSLLEGLAPAERATRLLETARYLRRASLPGDAAALLEGVLEISPERLDVRRELAEALLATGRRRRCEELLGRDVPEDTATENLIDAARFMLENDFCDEARRALRAGAARDGTDLELRTLLLKVELRLGNLRSGERLVRDARALADTPARYRLWLEAAAEFHEGADTLDAFLGDELGRVELAGGALEGVRLEGARLERVLVFADVAARGGRWSAWADESDRKAGVAAFLERLLGADPPPEARVKLRRRLVTLLSDETERREQVERQLKDLAREDPKSADEHNARLALLYWDADRADLAAPILEALDVARVSDAEVLGRLEMAYEKLVSSGHAPQGRPGLRGSLTFGRAGAKAMRVIERRTVLDPTNRGVWERWLEANARTGDESALRAAVRRLLAGIDRMPLTDDTRERLVGHLTDSYWRSTAKLIADGKESSLADALALVDAAERVASTRNQWLWANWARAYVLNCLGRLDARDEALDELERVAREAPLPAPEKKDGAAADGERQPAGVPKVDEDRPDPDRPATMEDGVAFPDGLTVSLERAREVLSRIPAPDDALVPLDREGPLARLAVKWAFDTPGGAAVVRIAPLVWPRLLVCDSSGALHCLDQPTGKLLWERVGAVAPTPDAGSSPWLRHSGGMVLNPPVPPVLAFDREGRVFVGGPGEATCLSAENGSTLWRVAVRGGGVPGSAPNVSVFVHEGRVLACAPASCTVVCLDPATGKVVWERSLDVTGRPPAGTLSSGASLSAGRLLVYGPRAAILDANTGEVEWSFEPERVRSFPLRLEEPRAPGAAAAAAAPAFVAFGAYPFGMQPPMQQRAYTRYGQTLVRGGYGFGSRTMTPPRPSYVAHLSRPSAGAAARGAVRTVGTVYAAPAAVWAANTVRERLGFLVGERVLLAAPSDLRGLRLDLPLAGKVVACSGAFVGTAGRTACFLDQGGVTLVDIVRGESHRFEAGEVSGRRGIQSGPGGAARGVRGSPTQGAGPVRFQAAIDGPLVYVTGPGGVMCVNARLRRRVLAAAWPEAAKPPEKAPKLAAAPPPLPVQTGMSRAHMRRLAMPHAAVQTTSIQYHLGGTCVKRGNVYGPCLPMVERAEGGILYATPAPSRVVAIIEERPLTDEEEKDW
jgi:tetratricopeptide (TPR) repeat protein